MAHTDELVVITQWVIGPEAVFGGDDTPAVALILMPPFGCKDLTDQKIMGGPVPGVKPNPNLVTVRIRCDEVNAALIDADPDCYVESWVNI